MRAMAIKELIARRNDTTGAGTRGALAKEVDRKPREARTGEARRGVKSFEPFRRLQANAALLDETGASLRDPRDEFQRLLAYHQKMYGTSAGGDLTRALARIAMMDAGDQGQQTAREWGGDSLRRGRGRQGRLPRCAVWGPLGSVAETRA